MSNTDLRVIKSKKSIRNAFLELMKEKDYQSITVKDIADRALINRKTFYFHYETKEALYNEIAGEITEIIKPKEILDYIQTHTKEGQIAIISHFLTELKKHKNICSAFLNDKTNPGFSDMIKQELSDALLSKAEINKRITGTDFTFEFLVDAYYSIFRLVFFWWLENDYNDPLMAINLLLDFFSKKPLRLLGIKYD